MILFQFTKKMFDQWVSKIIAFSLYPVLIFAFLGFCFLVVDKVTFGETKFIESPGTYYTQGKKSHTFNIDTTNISSPINCEGFKTTVGTGKNSYLGVIPQGCDCNGTHCMLNAITVSSESSGTIFGKSIAATVHIEDENSGWRFRKNIISLVFLMFIFYHLTKSIYSLLNVLSGSSTTISSIDSDTKFNPHTLSESAATKGIGKIQNAVSNNRMKNEDKKKRDGGPKGDVKLDVGGK